VGVFAKTFSFIGLVSSASYWLRRQNQLSVTYRYEDAATYKGPVIQGNFYLGLVEFESTPECLELGFLFTQQCCFLTRQFHC
jgi:hypothetical protein